VGYTQHGDCMSLLIFFKSKEDGLKVEVLMKQLQGQLFVLVLAHKL
jgi:hypothetical protein